MKKAYAIIIRNGLILLVRKPGLPVWDLPGGSLNPQLPEREALQELIERDLGFDIKVNELVGIYTREYSDDLTYVYKAQEKQSQSKMHSNVYSAFSFFDIDNLPLNIFPERRKQIRDYLTGRYPIRLRFKKNKWLHKIETVIKEKKEKQRV